MDHLIADKVVRKLTVYFEDPFWVGIFEQIDNGKLSVAKVTFGAEPKDYEIQEFVIRHYYHLKFSPSVDVKVKQDAINPKRRQREARKQSQSIGIGTKSQQAFHEFFYTCIEVKEPGWKNFAVRQLAPSLLVFI